MGKSISFRVAKKRREHIYWIYSRGQFASIILDFFLIILAIFILASSLSLSLSPYPLTISV